MTDWVDVVEADALTDGAHHVVDVDGVEVAVFNVNGEFFAIEDICTHDGGDLACGKLHSDQIECPRHGARFSLRTGAALTPPAYEAVATFPVRVQDGMLQVKDDRWD